jgi:predicted transcriptional regulator
MCFSFILVLVLFLGNGFGILHILYGLIVFKNTNRNGIDKLNKDFESQVRLGIMSVLMVNDWIDFTEMKSLLNITDGRFNHHSSTLEKSEYIEIKKVCWQNQ